MWYENVISIGNKVMVAVHSNVAFANIQNEGNTKFQSEFGKIDPVFHLPSNAGSLFPWILSPEALVEVPCTTQSQIWLRKMAKSRQCMEVFFGLEIIFYGHIPGESMILIQ